MPVGPAEDTPTAALGFDSINLFGFVILPYYHNERGSVCLHKKIRLPGYRTMMFAQD